MLTLNRKGQGLTEYGIILLLVCLIGIGIFSSSSAKTQIKSMYNMINLYINDIYGYDTGKTSTSSNGDVLHTTQLSDSSGTIYWYIPKGTSRKQYIDSTTNYSNPNNQLNQSKQTYYFKATNGNYYYVSGDGNEIHVYTGDTSFMKGKDYYYKDTP